MTEIIKLDDIAQLIYIIRGKKVIFDFDLSALYKVENKALKRQVRTNINRFPHDFMFQLTKEEWSEQVQNLHLLQKYKSIKSTPFAFTEQGVAMLSSVLRSEKAVEVNIAVMRAFVELRSLILNHEEVLRKISELEAETKTKLVKHDEQIEIIFAAIQKMIKEDQEDNNRKIGFNTNN